MRCLVTFGLIALAAASEANLPAASSGSSRSGLRVVGKEKAASILNDRRRLLSMRGKDPQNGRKLPAGNTCRYSVNCPTIRAVPDHCATNQQGRYTNGYACTDNEQYDGCCSADDNEACAYPAYEVSKQKLGWCSGWCTETKTTCRTDKYCSNRDDGTCNKCNAGYYLTSSNTVCTSCDTAGGNYCANGVSQSQYQSCSAGSERTGMSASSGGTCTTCPSGTAKTSTGDWKTKCTACGSGQYPSSASTCATCPAGFQCNGSDKKACPVGTYSGAGKSSCEACPEGTYCKDGAKEPCPTNTYHDKKNQGPDDETGTCKACPVSLDDQFTTGCGGTSSGSITACTSACDPGQYLEDRCGVGSTSNTAHCESCSAYAVSICDNNQFLEGCGSGQSHVNKGTCSSCKNHPTGTSACQAGAYLTTQCLKANGVLTDVSTCTKCQDCGDNKYINGCTADSAGACADCTSTCDVGDYMSNRCTGTETEATAQCVTCNTAQCSGLVPEQFLNGCKDDSPGSCSTCSSTQCGTDQYNDGCTGSSSGTCLPCTSSCLDGEYLVDRCTGKDTSSIAKCETCRTCAADEYLVGCDGTQPGSCVKCAAHLVCGQGHYRSADCTGGREDTSRCTSCTETEPCSEGYFREGCGGTSEGVCKPCRFSLDPSRKCPDAEYLQEACKYTGAPRYPYNFMDDTKCSKCQNCGEDKYTSGCTGAIQGSCQDCTVENDCGDGQYLEGRCMSGALSNTASCQNCQTCAEDEYLEDCAGDYPGRCRKLTICNGEGSTYMSVLNTATTDRECAECGRQCANPLDEYRNYTCQAYTGGPNTCTAATVCKEGEEYETVRLTTTSDRKCAPITACDYETEYLRREATGYTDTLCDPLTVCIYKFQYQSVNETQTSDRECKYRTQCDAKTDYVLYEGTKYTDRECTMISPVCEYPQFQEAEPTGNSDRVCRNCTDPLLPDEYMNQTAVNSSGSIIKVPLADSLEYSSWEERCTSAEPGVCEKTGNSIGLGCNGLIGMIGGMAAVVAVGGASYYAKKRTDHNRKEERSAAKIDEQQDNLEIEMNFNPIILQSHNADLVAERENARQAELRATARESALRTELSKLKQEKQRSEHSLSTQGSGDVSTPKRKKKEFRAETVPQE